MKVTYDKHLIQSSPIKGSEIAIIVEGLLNEAGLKRYWYDPMLGQDIYDVTTIPKDKILFGIRWAELKGDDVDGL